jgi:hypothetical protein
MTKKLLVEGYRPSGKEVSAVSGYDRGYQPASSSSDKAPSAPKPPKAISVIGKPKK